MLKWTSGIDHSFCWLTLPGKQEDKPFCGLQTIWLIHWPRQTYLHIDCGSLCFWQMNVWFCHAVRACTTALSMATTSSPSYLQRELMRVSSSRTCVQTQQEACAHNAGMDVHSSRETLMVFPIIPFHSSLSIHSFHSFTRHLRGWIQPTSEGDYDTPQ